MKAPKKAPASFRRRQVWHVDGVDVEIIDVAGSDQNGAACFVTWAADYGTVAQTRPRDRDRTFVPRARDVRPEVAMKRRRVRPRRVVVYLSAEELAILDEFTGCKHDRDEVESFVRRVVNDQLGFMLRYVSDRREEVGGGT